jgi:hypothetical protein
MIGSVTSRPLLRAGSSAGGAPAGVRADDPADQCGVAGKRADDPASCVAALELRAFGTQVR